MEAWFEQAILLSENPQEVQLQAFANLPGLIKFSKFIYYMLIWTHLIYTIKIHIKNLKYIKYIFKN